MQRFAGPERIEDARQPIAIDQLLIPGGTPDQAIGQPAVAVGHEEVARFDRPENAASSVLVQPFPPPDLNRLRVRDAFGRGYVPDLLVVPSSKTNNVTSVACSARIRFRIRDIAAPAHTAYGVGAASTRGRSFAAIL
jgi:hypothetical protein